MSDYRLIASDLDGTLTNDEKKITLATKSALQRVMQKGVSVVLSSGRPVSGVEYLAKELELDKHHGFILSLNGGKIIDFTTKEVLYNQTLPMELNPLITDFLRKGSPNVLTYLDDGLYTEQPDLPEIQFISKVSRLKIKRVKDLGREIPVPTNKIMTVGEPDRMAKLEQEIREYFGDQVSVFRSEASYLEVMPPNVSKAKGLARLLDHLHLTREQLIAFGDGFNDVPMIEFAGMGVAMANAQEPVRRVADFVTRSNEEDGIAYALDRFFPKK